MSSNIKNKIKTRIKNLAEIATTPERQKVLDIIEAGLDAIDTGTVLRKQVWLDANILSVKDHKFDLGVYKNIYVIGFGKASSKAAEVLDSIIGDRIREGVVVSLPTGESKHCDHIEVIAGTHPLPSAANVAATKKIIAIAEKAEASDLVICLISGGGSALLCGDDLECDQGIHLYNEYLKTKGEIIELNTVRKHISQVKGGGLAKMLHPATVVGLVFSDIAGDHYDFITSGPTYKDMTTVADAQTVIDKYHLDNFKLIETPKEDAYFENVTNIVMISNAEALEGMRAKAEELGLRARVVSSAVYSCASEAVSLLRDSFGFSATPSMAAKSAGQVVLAGGEIRIEVTKSTATCNTVTRCVDTRPGGRCQYLGMAALPALHDDETFCAFASDGTDNSDCAGVIIDADTRKRAKELGLDVADYLARFSGYDFFNKLGHEQIFTGNTESNVADLMVVLRK